MNDPAPSTLRRTLLLGGAAVAATALGAGLAWWRLDPGPAADDHGLWQMRFDTPEGGTLAMQALRGQPLLLNFWATWCAPCVEEMPEIDRFFQAHQARGWQVLGLAVDNADPVRRFLQRVPVRFPIALAGFGGIELSKALGNRAGALPFTVAFDATGAVVRRKLGQTNEAELTAWASAIDA